MNNSFRFVVIMLFLVGVMFGLALPGQAKSKESFDILAWPVFQEATENFSPTARFELAAMLHVHLHQYEQAIAFLEVLAKEHPNASGLWILMATAYNRLGEGREAWDVANIAITLDPFYEAYYLERGIASFQLGQDREAVDDLARHLKSFTTSAMGHFYLGLAQARLENLAEAQTALTRAGVLNPRLTLMTDYYLALIDAQTGRTREASIVLREVHDAFKDKNFPLKKLVRLQLGQVRAQAYAKTPTKASPLLDALIRADIQHAFKYTPKPSPAGR